MEKETMKTITTRRKRPAVPENHKGVRLQITGHQTSAHYCTINTAFTKNEDDADAPVLGFDWDFVHNSDFLTHYKTEESAWRRIKSIIKDKLFDFFRHFEKHSFYVILNKAAIIEQAIECCSTDITNTIIIEPPKKKVSLRIRGEKNYSTTYEIYTTFDDDYADVAPMIVVDMDFIRNSSFLTEYRSESRAWCDIKSIVYNAVSRDLDRFEEQTDMIVKNRKTFIKEVIERGKWEMKSKIFIS
jgi:hypothetical protein